MALRIMLTRWLNNSKGNTTVVFALCLPVIMGCAGLGVEVGFWQYRQREAQTAADLAAYAGAVSLRNSEPADQARDEAAAEAALHGFDASAGVLAATTPPQVGNFQNRRSMEVTISQTLPRFFSSMFDQSPMDVAVRAVATYEETADACLLALSHDTAAAIDLFGSSNVALIECEIMSNSIAEDAVLLRGSTDVIAPCINSVGGFAVGGGSADYELTGCAAPRTDLPRARDPYADVAPPAMPSSCTNTNGGNPHTTQTISAGASGVARLCNGVNLTGDTVFEPGVYIVDGGDFRIGAGASVYGEGVTFYLTDGARTRFNGSAYIELSAPPSGDYAGLVFFGDRTDFGVSHTFNGTADSLITGAVYLPAGDISFLGDFSGQEGCMQLVGHTVRIGGNANITTDCTGVGVQFPQVPSDVRLVE